MQKKGGKAWGPTPCAGVIDSQSLRGGDTVSKATRVYDAGKPAIASSTVPTVRPHVRSMKGCSVGTGANSLLVRKWGASGTSLSALGIRRSLPACNTSGDRI
jgi:hypothetical protein